MRNCQRRQGNTGKVLTSNICALIPVSKSKFQDFAQKSHSLANASGKLSCSLILGNLVVCNKKRGEGGKLRIKKGKKERKGKGGVCVCVCVCVYDKLSRKHK